MPPKTIRNGKKSFQAIKKENIARKEDANKTDKIKNMIQELEHPIKAKDHFKEVEPLVGEGDLHCQNWSSILD